MNTEEICAKQEETINYAKDYLTECKKSKIDVANSSFCYFAHWSQTLGSAKLRLKINGKKYFFSYLKIIIFNFFGVSTLSNYIIKKHNIENKKFKYFIITNVSKKDFRNDGSCFDPCFQTNSKKFPNALWFLNCVDNYIPKKFDENLIIFTRKNKGSRHDLIFLIISFLRALIKYKFSIKNIIHEFSFYSQFSNIISDKILCEISKGNFKQVINSYEAQPFQNNVFKKIKKINNKIKTVGFFHTALSPIATSLLYRSGAPDSLLISGSYSKKYLSKYLNWPKKKIRIVPSFRYNKKNISDMSGFIYLPFNFFNLKKITDEFENFLQLSNIKSLNNLKIKNHIYARDSKKHKKLIDDLGSLITKYKDRFNLEKKQKKSVIIGATSTVIVALQSKIEVIHICEDPVFESYSSKLWKTLSVTQVSSNTFIYKQKNEGTLVKFSQKSNMLRKYFY